MNWLRDSRVAFGGNATCKARPSAEPLSSNAASSQFSRCSIQHTAACSACPRLLLCCEKTCNVARSQQEAPLRRPGLSLSSGPLQIQSLTALCPSSSIEIWGNGALSQRSVAQLEEHWSPKPAVVGSSPSAPARQRMERVSSRKWLSLGLFSR